MNQSWNSRLSDCLFLFLNVPKDSLDIAFWLILRQKDPLHFCIVTGVFRFYPARWISGTFKAIWTLAKKRVCGATRLDLQTASRWPTMDVESCSYNHEDGWSLTGNNWTFVLLYFCCLGKRVDFGRNSNIRGETLQENVGKLHLPSLMKLLEVVWSDSSRGPRRKASWHVGHEGFFDQTTGPSSLPTSLTCIRWLLKGTHLNHTRSTPKMWCYQSGSCSWSSKQTPRRLSLRHSNDCFRMSLIT